MKKIIVVLILIVGLLVFSGCEFTEDVSEGFQLSGDKDPGEGNDGDENAPPGLPTGDFIEDMN